MLSAIVLLAAQAAPQALTSDNYAAVRAYVSPQEDDLAFQQIDWHRSFAEGVRAAQASDKPILLWLYFGDPRGGC
jgi:4-amino-4-deoxy-L-arabinose transferase-like glycosyltransferase